MDFALELVGIRKSFGTLLALDDVTLRIDPASVHGLLGENGAGKSTLMNIACGLVRRDAGEIRIGGAGAPAEVTVPTSPAQPSPRPRPRAACDPQSAIRQGLGMVHQHFLLAGAMTALDNVLLGDARARQWLDRSSAAASLARLGASVGLSIDPLARVDRLSVGQQQRVEILKALWREVRVLILDEPTAVLAPAEAEQLLDAVRRLRDRGCAVVFISHKLREVRRICDRLTVLRRGRLVWEGRPDQATDEELAAQMVGNEDKQTSGKGDTGMRVDTAGGEAGRDVRSEIRNPKSATAGSASRFTTLSLSHLTAPGVSDVSLDLAPGEILGIAGVDGNGQQELSELILGLRAAAGGRICFNGRDITAWSCRRRLELGIAHIPNDRQREALVETLSIAENLALKHHARPPLSHWGLLRPRRIGRLATELMRRFDIRAGAPRTPAGALSGGNQQKTVLARELGITRPRLIVAVNPARGLDIAATEFVYRQFAEHRARGCAILLISSELDELLQACDRIGVLYAGRLSMTDFPRTPREQIGRLMAGIHAPAPTA